MTAMSTLRRSSTLAFLLWTCCSGVDHSTAARLPPERVPLVWTSSSLVTQDSLLARAAAAIADDRPSLASRLLAARLQDPAQRTAATVLLAAEAAAGWQGWNEVQRLLDGEPWLDTLAQGRGRELLARAHLERSPRARSSDSAAAVHAARAALAADDGRTRGIRLALHARALDRLGQLDSAAATYREAARLLDDVADWLYLRAAAVSPSEGDRARFLANVRSTLARSRRLAAEAEGRLRTGDSAGAAGTWLLAGDSIAAYRVRLGSEKLPEVERAEIRAWLTQVLAMQPGSTLARDAAELLLARFAPLTSGEHLAIARSDAGAGAIDRAIRSFNAAFAMAAGSTQDRFTLATLLARAGRHADAAAQFARIDAPRALAGAAAYQRARSLLRAGRASESQRLLREITTRYADVPEASAQAHYLLGDLASDAGRDAEARRHWRQLVDQLPEHPLSQTAWFRAALLAYVDGDNRSAATEWDILAQRFPSGPERNAALYWAGRAWQRLGRTADAQSRWRTIIGREPRSYYAMLAARRLDEKPWAPASAGATERRDWRDHPAIPARFAEAAQGHMMRASLLDLVGLTPEAGIERDALFREANALQVAPPAATAPREPTGATGTPRISPDTASARALAASYAFSGAGFPSRAILLAERAMALGLELDATDWRLLYPITHRAVIAAEASRHRIDPALVPALIRQESRFTPTALSPAGARGLMQIMPTVGRSLARARSISPWEDVMLYQPDVNIELGTAHLASELRRTGVSTAHALAAYNAGGSRLARWRTMRGADDPEVFIERIPFVETRDYVRIVLRNREFYRALYALESTTPVE
jgi:soluble lytic murein transglycosylase